jgi:hypothetical protein
VIVRGFDHPCWKCRKPMTCVVAVRAEGARQSDDWIWFEDKHALTRLLSRSWNLADLRVLTCGVVAAGREICALAGYGAVAGRPVRGLAADRQGADGAPWLGAS